MEIFLGFLLKDYLFITPTIIFFVFLAWLLNGKNECDDLPSGVTPQASMKLSPPHRSPALSHRGPPHPCCCSPPPRHCSPSGMAGAAGTAGTAMTADSPAQGG